MKADDIPKSWYWRGRKRHLVTEVTDGDKQVLVYKEWSANKQRWIYHAEERDDVAYEVMLASRVGGEDDECC